MKNIIGNSQSILQLKGLISKVAKTNSSVLISGESGTGKELVASTIHELSSSAGAFVPVNCSAIPGELLESELFGHEKGSFTGAVATRQGRFEIANNGTVFLDEIGDMPLNMQVKLLRVLQEKTFERIGGSRSIKANVRVVSATHKDLEQAIKDNSFREDLFYRLNVFPIHVPSLRSRRGDIKLLIDYFLQKLSASLTPCIFTDCAYDSFLQYNWPGNVRELNNIIERLSILFPGQRVTANDLPAQIYTSREDNNNQQSQIYNQIDNNKRNFSQSAKLFDTTLLVRKNLEQDEFNLKSHMENLEVSYINEAMVQCSGVVSRAANRLGVRRTTLIEKIKKYNLSKRST